MKQQRPGQPDPQEFAGDYADRLSRTMQELQDLRSERYPLLTGQVDTTIAGRASNYANI